MRTRLWTVINALFLAAFLFSVVVQYNDPDPIRWIAIYGLAALACFLEMRRRTRFLLPLGLGLAAAIWAASIAPRILGDVRLADLFAEFEMKNAGVELAREMGGLLIVATWMFVLAAVAYATRKREASSQAA
jgi:hypothetical protein